MRVALISDIHANAVALQAVLEDIAQVGVDPIVCLGDVATLGPAPGAVIQMLRALGCPLRGMSLDKRALREAVSARDNPPL